MRLAAFLRAALKDRLPLGDARAQEEVRGEQRGEEHPLRRDEEDAGPHAVGEPARLRLEAGVGGRRAVAGTLAATANDGALLDLRAQCLVSAVSGGITRGHVGTRIVDEPSGESDDEDHRAKRDENEAEEDAEGEDRDAEADDRG